MLSSRLTPSLLLSAAVAVNVLLAGMMLGLAASQPWIGISVTPHAEAQEGAPWLSAADGPARRAGLSAPALIEAIASAAGGEAFSLSADDLLEEPDALPSYAAMSAFFARQDSIARLLSDPIQLTATPANADAPRPFLITPEERRPAGTLPLAFWLQIGVGLAGACIGAWVWALRRGEWATRFLAIAGAGLMLAAFPAAVYSTRELALPGGLFSALSAMNYTGTLTFGVGMVGLFLCYPRKLVAARYLLVPALVLAVWRVVDALQLAEGPPTGRHLPVLLAMLAIVVLVALQYRATRGDPRDRAALTWLGLAVIIGAGAFVGTVILPVALGSAAAVSQGQGFLFFLLIYVGVALGVGRYRLFQLDEWAFRVLFYVVGVLLLLVLDAILVMTVIDDRAPAFAVSLLVVGLLWLPLRDTLGRIVLRTVEPARGALFRQVMDVALTPPGRDQRARWRALLEGAFQPLTLTQVEGAGPSRLVENGLGLTVGATGDLPGYRLDYAGQGRKLFSPADVDLAEEVRAMLASALDSRAAYEKGVAEERLRIARDIHDNIGVQLMGALHSRDTGRKDLLIRETLTDLRDIVNNASNPDLSLDELLADLRSQISEHLFAAGMAMDWQATGDEAAILPLAAAHTLRSVVREAVQNALKHSGASLVQIVVRTEPAGISVLVADNGTGFDTTAAPAGNGLANMRARVTGLGGRFALTSGPGGTRIEARFPLEPGRSAT